MWLARNHVIVEKKLLYINFKDTLLFVKTNLLIALSLVHNMTQVVARPRDGMQHHAKICLHGDITLRGISSYCDKSYNVAQNRKKVYSERQSHDVATRRGALQRLASYCELGFIESFL